MNKYLCYFFFLFHANDCVYRQFLQGSIRQTPDAYLDELKDTLLQRTGQDVSLATIWRTLTRSGFTMKKVCQNTSCNAELTCVS
jgi:hypothetical protein